MDKMKVANFKHKKENTREKEIQKAFKMSLEHHNQTVDFHLLKPFHS